MTQLSSNQAKLGTWTFNEIKIEDKSLYEKYIKNTQYPPNLWSSNFDYIWAMSKSKTKKILWKVVDEMLVTFIHSRKNTLYLMCLPFGSGSPSEVVEVLYKCLNYCHEWNQYDQSKSIVKIINSMQLDFLRESSQFKTLFKTIPLVGIEKHFSIQSLLALQGKEFAKIRQRINKFCKAYPNARVRKYTEDDFEKIVELGKYWLETAGQKYPNIFDKVYFHEIIKHCNELNHLVLVIEIEDKIVGMISGSELPTGQSWWCLSKFINEFDGLSEFMIIELAKEINKINPEIEYMNGGSDLGVAGLRTFKNKFNPVYSLKRYRIGLR